MSPDTVAEAVAARLGVDKAVVMDPALGSLAAQYAKAELEVLHATKSALGSAGAPLRPSWDARLLARRSRARAPAGPPAAASFACQTGRGLVRDRLFAGRSIARLRSLHL